MEVDVMYQNLDNFEKAMDEITASDKVLNEVLG